MSLSLILAGGIVLVGLALVGEALRRVGVSPDASRRVVHVGVGLSVALAPWVLHGPGPLYVLAGLFVAANAVARYRAWFPGMHAARPQSWGTVLFPLAVLPVLALTWSVTDGRIPAFQAAFLVLAFADPVALWVGQRGREAATSDDDASEGAGSSEKTLRGSLAFGIAAAVACAGVLAGTEVQAGLGLTAVAVLVAAGAATVAERLGRHGWDNLYIVLAVLIVLIPVVDGTSSLLHVAVAGGTALGFGGGAYAVGVLDESGAQAGGLLALTLITFTGIAWIVPALAFFVLSSAVSKAGTRTKADQQHRVEKGSVRDAGQVLANGGVAWVLIFVAVAWPSPLVYAAYCGAFAAAAADTWATEIGSLSPGRPLSLRTLSSVPRGTSGAVSVTGTLGAVAGALSVGLSILPITEWAVGAGRGMPLVLVLALAGVAGAVADSIAGATIQAQYRDPATGEMVERDPAGAEDRKRGEVVRGLPRVNNDVVNVIGTLTGALVAAVLWSIAL